MSPLSLINFCFLSYHIFCCRISPHARNCIINLASKKGLSPSNVTFGRISVTFGTFSKSAVSQTHLAGSQNLMPRRMRFIYLRIWRECHLSPCLNLARLIYYIKCTLCNLKYQNKTICFHNFQKRILKYMEEMR